MGQLGLSYVDGSWRTAGGSFGGQGGQGGSWGYPMYMVVGVQLVVAFGDKGEVGATMYKVVGTAGGSFWGQEDIRGYHT